MHPILHLGPVEIPSYGTIIFFGLVIGTVIATFMAKKYNLLKLDIVLSTILATVGLLIGAKLIYILTVIPEIVQQFDYVRHHVFQTLIYIFSGYVFYGGLIGAVAGYYLYCKWFQIDFGALMNVIAPVIPLVHSFGRIGCFLGGCCYGIEYHGRAAIHYPYNEFVSELNEVPRFPVQLVESGVNFIFFLILLFFARKIRKHGAVLGVYLVGYAFIRFILEFFRGDVARGIFFGVSTSQWISLLLIPLGIYLIVRKTVSVTDGQESSYKIE